MRSIFEGKNFFALSFRELLLLSMTVSMGMLIFAGLGYALEKDEPNTMFYTLPQTLYWAIITMTSTGIMENSFNCVNVSFVFSTFQFENFILQPSKKSGVGHGDASSELTLQTKRFMQHIGRDFFSDAESKDFLGSLQGCVTQFLSWLLGRNGVHEKLELILWQ